MEKETIQIKMISAVNEALNFRKKTQDNESIISHITQFSSKQKGRLVKMAMIAAVSKALSIAETSKILLKDKDIINKVVKEFPLILDNIDKK